MNFNSPLREAQRIMAESIKSNPTPWAIAVGTGLIITFLSVYLNNKFDLIDQHSIILAEMKTRQDEIAEKYGAEFKALGDHSKSIQTQFEALQNQIGLLSQRFPAIDNHIAAMSKDTQNLYEAVGDIRTINEIMIRFGARLDALEAAKDLKWLEKRVEDLSELMDRLNERFHKIEIEMFQRQGPPSPNQHTFPLEPQQPPHQRMD